jgi:hypothetical protein
MSWLLLPFVILALVGFAFAIFLGLTIFMQLCYVLATQDWDALEDTWIVTKIALVALTIGLINLGLFKLFERM